MPALHSGAKRRGSAARGQHTDEMNGILDWHEQGGFCRGSLSGESVCRRDHSRTARAGLAQRTGSVIMSLFADEWLACRLPGLAGAAGQVREAVEDGVALRPGPNQLGQNGERKRRT